MATPMISPTAGDNAWSAPPSRHLDPRAILDIAGNKWDLIGPAS
jgi:hypothetical protein